MSMATTAGSISWSAPNLECYKGLSFTRRTLVICRLDATTTSTSSRIKLASLPCSKQLPFTGPLFPYVRSANRLSQPLHATVDSDLETTPPDLKDIRTTLKNAKIVIESRETDSIQVRVDLTGKQTRKVFDDVLTNFARTAPAIPGFRRQKGGKTSNVPKDYLLRAIGEARVVKFVIQEIVSTSMTVYVEENKLNVKKAFKTIQTAEELEQVFEPGKDFRFNATMEVEKSEPKVEPELELEPDS